MDNDDVYYKRQYELPFYEVLDWHLSVRTVNCLLRDGIKTVADIQEAFRDGRILKIRNFGLVSFTELRTYMMQAGYEVPEINVTKATIPHHLRGAV